MASSNGKRRADSHVWVGPSRSSTSRLDAGRVLGHPFMVGELACGRIRNREEILRLLSGLPQAPVATHEEAIRFLEARGLMGRGVGYVDVHLLASVALAEDARLWTRDRRLQEVANELGLRRVP